MSSKYRNNEIFSVFLRDNDTSLYRSTDTICSNDIQISPQYRNHIYILSSANNIYHVNYKNFMRSKQNV